MSGEPTWLDRLIVDACHQDTHLDHGGQAGVRDDNAIESALARPRNRRAYDDEHDLCVLAAAYGFGLARNHGYVDGNKRIAFLATYVFLGLNGLEIEAAEPDVVTVMTALASGEVDEAAFVAWLREHVEPLA